MLYSLSITLPLPIPESGIESGKPSRKSRKFRRKRLATLDRSELRTVCSASAASARIHHWIHESRWPERDFEPNPNMDHPAPKRSRSSSSQGLESSWDTPSDRKSRDKKSSPYLHSRYETLLQFKGSFMKDSEAGILAV